MKFYTLADLAKMLSIGKSTIEKEIRYGRFPKGTKIISKRLVWTEQDIMAWFESKRKEGKNHDTGE